MQFSRSQVVLRATSQSRSLVLSRGSGRPFPRLRPAQQRALSSAEPKDLPPPEIVQIQNRGQGCKSHILVVAARRNRVFLLRHQGMAHLQLLKPNLSWYCRKTARRVCSCRMTRKRRLSSCWVADGGATSFLNTLDTTDYNVVVVSPKNYFLFTPLLPSVAVGTLSPRSIIQPTRYVTRHKARAVEVIEAEAHHVDVANKTVSFTDNSDIQGAVSATTIAYDYLVYAVGAEVQTFGIPGVTEHACFMKELHDAEKMQRRFLDCLESAAFHGQSQEEIERLLHIVVVGGGPTGVELSGELHDFLEEDLKSWYPGLADNIKITLVEALPSVLPMFSKRLIDYTMSTFKESKIDILTQTMVKEVKDKSVTLALPSKGSGGNALWNGRMGRWQQRTLSHPGLDGPAADRANQQAGYHYRRYVSPFPHSHHAHSSPLPEYMEMKGSDGSIFAIGDCTASSHAPTAQVASQQGAYLARAFAQRVRRDNLQAQATELERSAAMILHEDERKKTLDELEGVKRQLAKFKIRPFSYSHQGTLAYIGSDKAIADLPFLNGSLATGGFLTFYFWRSAYLSTLFSLRNRTLVATDWLRTQVFGRCVFLRLCDSSGGF
ncbi:Mitochondrial external NADH dehydrogenase [Mycena sanguinolenta]|uniref:NADH:ubiquinone reductase (non-electrogenic) n=1 Tax=Mycena sanguinolenta TaxID=230812 RepID=A0A8H7DMD2_9AGAR|nr:Mitochondrial external NADH dehydrogenase [Mycena sanguinolenta]